jgi:hypothetical protein
VGTGILPVLYGQARRLSHQAMPKLGMPAGDLNQVKLLASAIVEGGWERWRLQPQALESRPERPQREQTQIQAPMFRKSRTLPHQVF